jgi:hypothetical protein
MTPVGPNPWEPPHAASPGLRARCCCEFFFGAGRKPARLGFAKATVRFNGNARVLPELEGPERVLPRMPDLSP